jgi:hypothetical protein
MWHAGEAQTLILQLLLNTLAVLFQHTTLQDMAHTHAWVMGLQVVRCMQGSLVPCGSFLMTSLLYSSNTTPAGCGIHAWLMWLHNLLAREAHTRRLPQHLGGAHPTHNPAGHSTRVWLMWHAGKTDLLLQLLQSIVAEHLQHTTLQDTAKLHGVWNSRL